MLHHRIKQHIWDNKIPYIIVLTSLILGIFIGQVQMEMLDKHSTTELQQWLEGSVSDYETNIQNENTLFWLAFQQQCKSILMIWFLGMTLIGTPLILGILFYRGIALGFTFHLLFYLKDLKGIGIFFTSVLPQNLIYLPCLLIWSVFALNLSRNLLKKKKNRHASFSSLFLKYQLTLPVFVSVMAAGALIESWLAPNILHFIL